MHILDWRLANLCLAKDDGQQGKQKVLAEPAPMVKAAVLYYCSSTVQYVVDSGKIPLSCRYSIQVTLQHPGYGIVRTVPLYCRSF